MVRRTNPDPLQHADPEPQRSKKDKGEQTLCFKRFSEISTPPTASGYDGRHNAPTQSIGGLWVRMSIGICGAGGSERTEQGRENQGPEPSPRPIPRSFTPGPLVSQEFVLIRSLYCRKLSDASQAIWLALYTKSRL